ncbi:MAG: lemA, partial [Bryobacterales bacterium]|nr:lemA [Bryobacterales bacterium]
MKRGGLLVIGIIILVVLIFGGRLMGQRNTLVTQKNEIDARWAQIDNDMKRRADLIPNLVETVKGYAKQEQTVFGD